MYFLSATFWSLSKDKVNSECSWRTKDILLDYKWAGITEVWQTPIGCIKWNIQYSVEYPLIFKGSSCILAMAHQPLCLLSWSRVVTHKKANHSRIQVPGGTQELSFYPIYWTLWVFTQLITQSWQGIVYVKGKATLTPLTNVSARDQSLIWTFGSFVSFVHAWGNDSGKLHRWSGVSCEFSLRAPQATWCTETRMWLVFASAHKWIKAKCHPVLQNERK